MFGGLTRAESPFLRRGHNRAYIESRDFSLHRDLLPSQTGLYVHSVHCDHNTTKTRPICAALAKHCCGIINHVIEHDTSSALQYPSMLGAQHLDLYATLLYGSGVCLLFDYTTYMSTAVYRRVGPLYIREC